MTWGKPQAITFWNGKPAVVAEWAKESTQIQVELLRRNPGSNPAWDYEVSNKKAECNYYVHLL